MYGLDPTHFCSAPSLSWEACLKLTGIRLQILVDPDMTLFIDSAMIGGVSMARNPHLVANNEMVPNYDASKPKTWLTLFDENNQYGGAMSQPLPKGGFVWVENVSKFENVEYILSLRDDQQIGYFLEVDLSYPRELHEEHNQYPLAPEHRVVTEDMLSDFQIRLAKSLNLKIGGSKKLLLTLLPKLRYKLHYRNLKQYLEMGLVLEKVHRVLQFTQSRWVKKYIDLNTQIRRSATCKADEV